MKKFHHKLGYSDIGGIYMGQNIQGDFHSSHTITIIISQEKEFVVEEKDAQPFSCHAVVIQKDVNHKLLTNQGEQITIIHLDPYSEFGLSLNQKSCSVKIHKKGEVEDILPDLNTWFLQSENREEETIELIAKTVACLARSNPQKKPIDSRIVWSMQYIRTSEDEKISLKEMAEQVHLSESRFAHLFKESTELPFRKYVLHCKLLKSLRAMHQQENLTSASFEGGFSDQPHFTRTFKKAFGLRPSSLSKE
ncbi:MAG: AraC family transcriptional regulator [Cyclobacteriaceae bacterium]|nr:AraC family transcriptional regulator [Cyclobacteriaceae bacterium]